MHLQPLKLSFKEMFGSAFKEDLHLEHIFSVPVYLKITRHLYAKDSALSLENLVSALLGLS